MVEIHTVDYLAFKELLHAVRMEVFVREQGVPADMEIDALDPECVHVAAHIGTNYVGTGRMTPNGRIGRMAVLPEHRGQGIGRRILLRLVEEAQVLRLPQVVLSSQVHACDFYRKLGFEAEGEVYKEAGIDHIRMRREL